MIAGLNGQITRLLEADELEAGYGHIPVLRGISLHVDTGEVVALLGANGAGKTTTLLALAGNLDASAGEVRLRGHAARRSLHRRARQGIALIPEERAIVPSLSARDNLRLGRGNVDDAVDVFPVLGNLLSRKAGLLSGGEQQMLVLARAIASNPSVLLVDEVSLGLAPLAVEAILNRIRGLADERGFGALLVEQRIRNALDVADRAYVLSRGAIVMEGTAAQMHDRIVEIENTYLSGPRIAS